jgi:hypothetical protein
MIYFQNDIEFASAPSFDLFELPDEYIHFDITEEQIQMGENPFQYIIEMYKMSIEEAKEPVGVETFIKRNLLNHDQLGFYIAEYVLWQNDQLRSLIINNDKDTNEKGYLDAIISFGLGQPFYYFYDKKVSFNDNLSLSPARYLSFEYNVMATKTLLIHTRINHPSIKFSVGMQFNPYEVISDVGNKCLIAFIILYKEDVDKFYSGKIIFNKNKNFLYCVFNGNIGNTGDLLASNKEKLIKYLTNKFDPYKEPYALYRKKDIYKLMPHFLAQQNNPIIFGDCDLVNDLDKIYQMFLAKNRNEYGVMKIMKNFIGPQKVYLPKVAADIYECATYLNLIREMYYSPVPSKNDSVTLFHNFLKHTNIMDPDMEKILFISRVLRAFHYKYVHYSDPNNVFKIHWEILIDAGIIKKDDEIKYSWGLEDYESYTIIRMKKLLQT